MAMDVLCVPTGTRQLGATKNHLVTSMNVPDVEKHRTALRSAVLQRRRKPLTPLIADQWDINLRASRLLTKYPQIPEYIRHGAHAGIPQIHRSHTPPNNQSTETIADVFNEMIQSEFDKGRYLGPFSQEELESEIGPFQSSPLSLVPKAGKPGKFRLIQNLSHPPTNHPVPSINALLNSDDFPCTWGTFRTVCALIRNLPRGTKISPTEIRVQSQADSCVDRSPRPRVTQLPQHPDSTSCDLEGLRAFAQYSHSSPHLTCILHNTNMNIFVQ